MSTGAPVAAPESRRTALSARLQGVRGRMPRTSPVIVPAAALAVLGVAAFVIGAWRGDVAAEAPLGIAFGIAAAVSLAAVMLYSARRSLPAVRRLGATRWYLQVHLWGGALFMLLFLMHTGFAVPAGLFPFTLWLLSAWVVVTGAVGVVLQRAVPRLLAPNVSFEVHLDRVPELVAQLRERADRLVASADTGLRTYYDRQLAPAMAAPRMSASVLFRNPRVAARGVRDVELLRRTLTADGNVTLDELRELHAAKHELDVHYTLQRVLRTWLYLHLPAAVVLLALVLLHIFFILYF